MSGSETPARPDAPPGASLPGRRWLPVWIVIAVIAVTTLGGFVTAAALPEPDAASLSVGSVTVHPLRGWTVTRRAEPILRVPAGGSVPASLAQLTRGNGGLTIVVIRGLGVGPEDASRFYADVVLSNQLERPVFIGRSDVVLRSGLPAVRSRYIGIEPRSGLLLEGSITVAVGASGDAAVLDGWAFERQLRSIEDDLATMADTAEIR